jgi:hypothetical protein
MKQLYYDSETEAYIFASPCCHDAGTEIFKSSAHSAHAFVLNV